MLSGLPPHDLEVQHRDGVKHGASRGPIAGCRWQQCDLAGTEESLHFALKGVEEGLEARTLAIDDDRDARRVRLRREWAGEEAQRHHYTGQSNAPTRATEAGV